MAGQKRDTVRTTASDFWGFYRDYTKTAMHTASAAALAIFGLLVFVDPLFALLAIASYVFPPVVLFTFKRGESIEAPAGHTDPVTSTGDPIRTAAREEGRSIDGGQSRRESTSRTSNFGDTDTDAGDGDTDTDYCDGNTDSGDGDADSDDGDSDTDTDS